MAYSGVLRDKGSNRRQQIFKEEERGRQTGGEKGCKELGKMCVCLGGGG